MNTILNRIVLLTDPQQKKFLTKNSLFFFPVRFPFLSSISSMKIKELAMNHAVNKSNQNYEISKFESTHLSPSLLFSLQNQLVSILNEYCIRVGSIRVALKEIAKKAKIDLEGENELQESVFSENGISFLDVKLKLMLQYCIHIVEFCLEKLQGHSTERHDVVKKLFEARTFIEKMKPIDLKLKYQVCMLVL